MVRSVVKVKPAETVTIGHVTGIYGVQGWVKIHSFTDPSENIGRYDPWLVHIGGEWRVIEVCDTRRHGKAVIARLKGYADRDAARALVGAEIAVRRDQLAEIPEGEYYWADLVGLQVVTVSGTELGVVDHLIETGANDVLVVVGERERLIPFIRNKVVVAVDLDRGEMRVDWDPEF